MVDTSMFICIKPERLVDVVSELQVRQYSQSDIESILGKNMLRVIDMHTVIKI